MNNLPSGLRVMDERCNQCLFTKDRIVDGQRAAEVLQSCKDDGTHFVCHKASEVGQNAMCREFFNRSDLWYVQVAKRLGRVIPVKVQGNHLVAVKGGKE